MFTLLWHIVRMLYNRYKPLPQPILPIEPVIPSTPTQPMTPDIVTPPPAAKTDLITLFCNEIQIMEGWFEGSTSYENNNPGNLRCTPGQQKVWNQLATGTRGGFCVFKDPPTGRQALRNVTVSVAKGLSPTYNAAAHHFGLTNCGELNLYQYFVVRDPVTDGNQPTALAERFGKVLNHDPATFKMKMLLG